MVVREIIFNYHCAIRCVVSYINVAFTTIKFGIPSIYLTIVISYSYYQKETLIDIFFADNFIFEWTYFVVLSIETFIIQIFPPPTIELSIIKNKGKTLNL